MVTRRLIEEFAARAKPPNPGRALARLPAPPRVPDWLERPTRTRGLPDRDPASFIEGGALGQWYDMLVHSQVVTAAHS